MRISNKKEKTYQILAFIWALLGFAINIYYIVSCGKWIVDSDMSSELILADLLNKEKSILSNNWFYGNELRVFHLQWFLRVGLLIAPDNWNCARAIGMGMLYLLVFATACVFAKNCRMGSNGIWFAATLLWPIGFWYHFVGTWGGYYLVYIFGTLACLACVLKISETAINTNSNSETIKHIIVPSTIGTLLAFCSGLNGIRQMQVFFLPCLAASIILLIIRVMQNQSFISAQNNRKEIVIFSSAAVFFVANLIGYLFNTFVLSTRYTFKNYNTIGWLNNRGIILSVFEDYFKMFGFTPNMRLFSVGGIASGIGLLIALVVIVLTVYLLYHFNRISENDQFLLLLCLVAFVINGVTLTYLNISADTYWVPFLVYGWVIVYISLKYVFLDLSRFVALFLALGISLCSFVTIRHSVVEPYRGSYELFQISQKLQELGLNKGCSLFWSSNNITEMTDGKIEMWTVNYEDDDSLQIYPLFQVKSHNEFPEGKFFVLLPNTMDVMKINGIKDMNITDSFSVGDYTITIIN